MFHETAELAQGKTAASLEHASQIADARRKMSHGVLPVK